MSLSSFSKLSNGASVYSLYMFLHFQSDRNDVFDCFCSSWRMKHLHYWLVRLCGDCISFGYDIQQGVRKPQFSWNRTDCYASPFVFGVMHFSRLVTLSTACLCLFFKIKFHTLSWIHSRISTHSYSLSWSLVEYAVEIWMLIKEIIQCAYSIMQVLMVHV